MAMFIDANRGGAVIPAGHKQAPAEQSGSAPRLRDHLPEGKGAQDFDAALTNKTVKPLGPAVAGDKQTPTPAPADIHPALPKIYDRLDHPSDNSSTVPPPPSQADNIRQEAEASRNVIEAPGVAETDSKSAQISQIIAEARDLITNASFRRHQGDDAVLFLVSRVCASGKIPDKDERVECMASEVKVLEYVYRDEGPFGLKELVTGGVTPDPTTLPQEIFLRTKISNLRLLDRLADIPISAFQSSKIVNYLATRPMVVVKFGRIKIPFYLSSGLSRKKDVESGKWYPFFGLGKDGWINKCDTPGALNMQNYYCSKKLEEVARQLDQDFGNIFDESNVLNRLALASFDEENEHVLNTLNEHMTPVEYENCDDVVKHNEDMIALIEAQDNGTILWEVAAKIAKKRWDDGGQGEDGREGFIKTTVAELANFYGSVSPGQFQSVKTEVSADPKS